MEKLKVTAKQFDWLERYKSDEEIDYAIDIQPHRKRPDSPIVDWKSSEVARSLYNGYELEPEYVSFEVAMKALKNEQTVVFHDCDYRFAIESDYDFEDFSGYTWVDLIHGKWTLGSEKN